TFFWFIRRERAPGLKRADMLTPLGVALQDSRGEASMSTSLLYHAFGTRGYRYVRTAYTGGQTTFTPRQEPGTCRCSACGSGDVISRGHVERRFRSLPIGSRATSLVLPVPRVECRACGVVRQVDVTFADPRRTYTRAFRRYVLELSRRMTIR